jgi:hypothetical protein
VDQRIGFHELGLGKAVGGRASFVEFKSLLTWLTTSGGVFTGGDGVEYRWKSHRRRLQVNQPFGVRHIDDDTHP